MVKEYFTEASIANFTPHPARPQTWFKSNEYGHYSKIKQDWRFGAQI
jgi:hypothetical protein